MGSDSENDDFNVSSLKNISFGSKFQATKPYSDSDSEEGPSFKPGPSKANPFSNISFVSKAQKENSAKKVVEPKKKAPSEPLFGSFGKNLPAYQKESKPVLPVAKPVQVQVQDSSKAIKEILVSTRSIIKEVIDSHEKIDEKRSEKLDQLMSQQSQIIQMMIEKDTKERKAHKETTSMFINAIQGMFSSQAESVARLNDVVTAAMQRPTSVNDAIVVPTPTYQEIDEDSLASIFSVLEIVEKRFESNKEFLGISVGDEKYGSLSQALESLLEKEKTEAK